MLATTAHTQCGFQRFYMFSSRRQVAHNWQLKHSATIVTHKKT